jgi:hypothetical protein
MSFDGSFVRDPPNILTFCIDHILHRELNTLFYTELLLLAVRDLLFANAFICHLLIKRATMSSAKILSKKVFIPVFAKYAITISLSG